MIGILLSSVILGYLLIRFLVFLVNHLIKRRKYSHIPQLHTLPLIGNIGFFRNYPINYHFIPELTKYANNFINSGKIFMIWLTVVPAVVIFNKNYIKLLLSKNDEEVLGKGEILYKGIDEIVPNNLLTLKGDEWKIRRKILSQPFHTTNLGNFVKVLNEESRKSVKYFKKKQCKDLIEEMQKLTIQLFSRVLFEYDLDEMNELDYMVELNRDVTGILTRKAFSIFLVSPFLYRFTSLATEETNALKNIIKFEDRLLRRKTGESIETLKSKILNKDLDDKTSNLTLIEILLKNFKNTIKEKTKQWAGFDMAEIQSQLTVFIIAGFDTVSATLTFLIYHLAKYPEYQEQIYKEIVDTCGNDPNHEFTLDEIKSCALLNAFVNESMRFQPIAPVISRYPIKDIKLDDKYTIPAYTDIAIFIGQVLKDPDYFPEPEIFKPERFLEDQSENLFTNIPFSAGPRNCIAKKFALHVLSFTSAFLIQTYKIQLGKNTPKQLGIKFELVNKPIETIEIDFVERNNN